jgi:putative nucleotidyltransferase with HDIG domain
MSISADLVVDAAKIKRAAHTAVPLSITTYTLPHEIEVYLEEVLDVFLSELGQRKLKDYLTYCIRELAVNAKKANTKRAYFMEKGLDINKPEDYERGMRDFKRETLEDINRYLHLLKDKAFYVKVVFRARDNKILLEVRNNAELTREEYIRIHDKLQRSRVFNSLEDALQQVLDPTEGAGLGIVIMVLMLKKIGLNEDAFAIDTEKGETVARILIPVDQTRIENLSLLANEVVRKISHLPQFPENIVTIQRILSDPKSQIVDIARYISTDPAMTADLLKMVNSAKFMLVKKVDSISEAVKLVGLRGIKNLLYSYGTQKILGAEQDDEKKRLWEHSYRAAFYAYNLAKNFKRSKALLDDVYVGGMLHDMGKIVFSSVHPELIEHIKRFCAEKGIPAQFFEDLSAGMNHAEIGAKIAEKWNFPESLVNAIRYHHEPGLTGAEHKDIVDTVYLANAMCDFQSGLLEFEQIDRDALENYGINTLAQFQTVLKQFSAGFSAENVRR